MKKNCLIFIQFLNSCPKQNFVTDKYHRFMVILLMISMMLFGNYENTHCQPEWTALSGTVVDAETGEVLPGANVILKPGLRGTATDLQGRFRLSRLLSGKYELQVSFIGYETYRDSVVLTIESSSYLHIALKVQPVVMREVMVSAGRDRLTHQVNLSQDVLDIKELRMTSSVAEPDLFRSMALLPGVISTNDYNTRFYVRGGRGNENHVLVDGVTLHNPYHAFGFFSIFDVDAIKTVEIYRGIFPARYSERLSSVTNVTLKDGNAQRFSAMGMLSLATSKLLLEAPILKYRPDTGRKWTLMLNGRRTYIDRFFEVPFYFYDLSAKSVYDSGHRTRIIWHGFVGVDRIKPDPKEGFSRIDWKNRATGMQWYQFLSPRHVLNMSLSYGDFSTTAKELSPEDDADESLHQLNQIEEFDLHSEWNCQLYDDLKATLGYDFSRFTIDEYLESFYKEIFQGRWHKHDHHKAYLSIQGRWQNLWIFEFGVTGLYFSSRHKPKLAPRFGMKWLLSDQWRLKAGLGRHYQALTTINDDDDAVALFDAWIPSPEDRPIPHADHYGLGIEFDNASSVEADLELYYRHYDGLTRFNRSQRAGEPFYLGGWAESYGMEIRLNYQFKHFYGFVNYALGKATSHFFLRNRPMRYLNDFRWQAFPSAGDVRHILNTVIGMRPRRKWDLSLSLVFQTGRPYTAELGTINKVYAPPTLMRDNYFRTGSSEVLYSSKNSCRFPSYQRMDIRAARDFTWQNIKFSLFIQIYNILFRRNTAFHYSSDNKLAYGLPILPTIGINFKF